MTWGGGYIVLQFIRIPCKEALDVWTHFLNCLLMQLAHVVDFGLLVKE